MSAQAVPSPIVRYHILCENVRTDEDRPSRISIDGLIHTIRSLEVPAFPLLYEEICVLLLVAEGRGTGVGHIRCVFEETGETIFRTPDRELRFDRDPLLVTGMTY